MKRKRRLTPMLTRKKKISTISKYKSMRKNMERLKKRRARPREKVIQKRVSLLRKRSMNCNFLKNLKEGKLLFSVTRQP
jgi:hypothetical protein